MKGLAVFGRSKLAKVEETRAFGWKMSHLEAFADKLAGQHPLIQTTISGIRHSVRIDGEAYSGAVAGAKSEQETYRSMPMLFDEPPIGENFCRLMTDDYELAGTMTWPSAVVQGSMAVARDPSAIINCGIIGHLSITSLDSGTERPAKPLVNFHFDVLVSDDLERIRTSIQNALSGNGMAWANFLIRPIENRNDWITYFVSHGFCSGLEITKVYLGTSAGHMFDD